MTELSKPKKGKLGLVIYFYAILILLLWLTVASYTWFSLTKTPRVSNLSLYINSLTGMQISLDPDSDEWGQQVSFLDMVSENAPLRPVTYSYENDRFYAAHYTPDGRLTDNWEPLSDEYNANRDHYDSYYCYGTFYARTDEKVRVSLASAVALDEGLSGSGTYLIGTPLWNSESIAHDNGGHGAEYAVRVGIKVTRLNADNTPTDEAPLFYIYEPNCDMHLDGWRGYDRTPSIDGTQTLVPPSQILTQTTSSWSETDPVEKNVQIHSFGEFTSSTDLFTMEPNETVMIQLYIWLEGQDRDCTNEIEEAQILANIQFKATTEPSSGLQPVDGE